MYIFGVIIIILGAIVGFFIGTYLGVLTGSVFGGFIGFLAMFFEFLIHAIIFISISKILEIQEDIIIEIRSIKDDTRKFTKDKKCTSCQKTYPEDYASCPNYGKRT